MHIRLLQITDSDLYYGGAHRGTFTVNEVNAKELRDLLQEIDDELTIGQGCDPDIRERVRNLIDHINSFVEYKNGEKVLEYE